MKKKNGYWNYETCMEESKKYKSRNEFDNCCRGGYDVARKNGWLDEYTWLISPRKTKDYWNYETCMEESRNYTTRTEFQKGSNGAYHVARRNGWLDEYTWLESKFHADWNYETCIEESRNYTTRTEFQKGSNGAYLAARKNGWLDEFTWLKDERFDMNTDKIDSVYVYEFKELNCAYVGRTLMRCQKDRDRAHIFRTDNDAVAKFAKEHNISVPKPIYLEENLTLKEGAKQEGYWLNKYIEDGWTMLNRAKTGSIGGLGKGKWNKKTCMEESKKYKSRGEFCKGNGSAYQVALKNGWLDEYTWLGESKTSKKWNYETCMEESKKYDTRKRFCNGCVSAYQVALKNGWLDEYTWFKLCTKPRGYWNYETCMEESKKYKTRAEFSNGCSRAYELARKNGWLDDYIWLEYLKKPNGYWTYETCMEESKKYDTRKKFCNGCVSAYQVALKNGWLDDFFPKCNDLAMAA